MNPLLCDDPILLLRACWPKIEMYDKQKEILCSLRDNDETVVPAGNQLGKDFVAAYAVLWFFLSRHPCRIVTTSVDAAQLEGVLWGEIRRFIQTSEQPLPLVVNHLHLRKMVNGKVDGTSYVLGRVTAKDEGMLGHHVARGPNGLPTTLWIADEASSLATEAYTAASTWAHRMLIIGNCYMCQNFFRAAVKEGDLKIPDSSRYYRKVIKIKASQSPNVRHTQAEIDAKRKPTNAILVPGVVDYETYLKRRKLWDKIRQCIGLDADFYEGSEELLFPPDWLNNSERMAKAYHNSKPTHIGCDPGEGGDSTVWALSNRNCLCKLISKKTVDTVEIVDRTKSLIWEYGIAHENVLFDAGGGGKQHADRLRSGGFNVKLLWFGGAATKPPKRGYKTYKYKLDDLESKYVYLNKRAEMYGLLSTAIDPSNEIPFGIPAEYTELRRQLACIPKIWDEGRLRLPPKHRVNPNSKEITMQELLGRSPDEADALVLSTYGIFGIPAPEQIAGVLF